MQIEIVPQQNLFINSLRRVSEDPKCLIPRKLHELVDNPANIAAIPFRTTLGRFDNEYEPTISTAIVERDKLSYPTAMQESAGIAKDFINKYRTQLISNNAISNRDYLIAIFIAQEWNKSLGWPDNGVFIEYYVQAEQMQGKGLGYAFFENFDSILTTSGYQFWCGHHSEQSFGFFLRIGAARASSLTPGSYLARFLKYGTSSIKFLDENTQRKYVQ